VSLAKYHAKRHFDRTPEPRGHRAGGRGPLRLVVQKHAASRLHYDFRLELDGTLKSWAVPKGPSLNPVDKRLAMIIEDHPLDYRTFEGIIPEGNYGAGTVIVWDEGTYSARETADRAEGERLLREGLRKGHLRIVLNGQKLKGEFSLLKLKRGNDNAWLLVKGRDEFASDTDVTAQDRSVSSGRTLDDVAAKRKGVHVWKSNRPAKTAARPKPQPREIELNGAPKGAAPHNVKPMLASLVDEPFDRAGWIFELKWEGYRAIAEVGGRGVRLYSRNHKSFEQKFAPIVETLRGLGHKAVIDGEIVVLDDRGRSHFQLLQNYQTTGEGRLQYYVFDLLYLDGRDLRGLPLRRRKELLAEVIRGVSNIHLSEHVEEKGVAFFKAAEEQGLEGIIAKDAESVYREGVRSHAWLKIKTHRRQEAVIGGFTEPRGSRKNLGALVLGVYEGNDLVYIGHTGGGLNTRGLADLRSRLQPLVQRQCPFKKKPKANAPVHWVEPKLVCEVTFQEWTGDGRMRIPIFVGLREDKPAHSVRRERAEDVGDALEKEAKEQKPARRATMKSADHRSVKAGSLSDGRKARTVAHASGSNGRALTNLDKLYFPDDGYTKGDLINYYREIAAVILPYLRDRPESLHRHPNGIDGDSFFQKDVRKTPPPDWVETVPITSESDGEVKTYIVCQNEPTLLYLANLGCIEINPWNSRVESQDHPDYLIIDLDPEAVSFDRVIEAAIAVRKQSEKAGAECYCKTSGKRGLHVFVPLAAKYDYDQARQFAEIIANLVHNRMPDSTSVVRMPAKRQGRVYLDYLQNRRGQTLAAPYSVRPYPGATVSTPLKWSEVRKGLDPTKFTIRTIPKRLEKVGDLWEPVLGHGIDLETCLGRLK
jgi:bifunctional non-homologous end joining protein LigD